MPNEQKPVVTLVAGNAMGNIVITGVADSVVQYPYQYTTVLQDVLTITDPVIHGSGESVDGHAIVGTLTFTNSNGTSIIIDYTGRSEYIATHDALLLSANTDLVTPFYEICKLAVEPETPRKVACYVWTFVFSDGAYAVITEKDGLVIESDWIGCEPRYDTSCSGLCQKIYDDGTYGNHEYAPHTVIQFTDFTKKDEPCCGKPETCENVTCSYLSEETESTRGWHSVDDDCESLGGCCGDNCGDEYEDPHTEEWVEYRDLSLDVSRFRSRQYRFRL